MAELQQFPVMGVPVHLSTDYLDWLVQQAQAGRGGQVVTLNAEMTMQAEQNPELAQIIRQAELVVPDGAGVVLYLRLQGRHIQRCPGIELAKALLHQAALRGEAWPVFFYGGAPGVTEQAGDRLRQELPGLAIAGVSHGFLSPEEQEALAQTLQAQQPKIILVGLGVPRQEFWIQAHRHLCPDALWIGVGGSFDIWSGTKARAPQWLCKYHLEWAYRLYQEPWRWRRMGALPKFAWRALVYRLFPRHTVGQSTP